MPFNIDKYAELLINQELWNKIIRIALKQDGGAMLIVWYWCSVFILFFFGLCFLKFFLGKLINEMRESLNGVQSKKKTERKIRYDDKQYIDNILIRARNEEIKPENKKRGVQITDDLFYLEEQAQKERHDEKNQNFSFNGGADHTENYYTPLEEIERLTIVDQEIIINSRGTLNKIGADRARDKNMQIKRIFKGDIGGLSGKEQKEAEKTREDLIASLVRSSYKNDISDLKFTNPNTNEIPSLPLEYDNNQIIEIVENKQMPVHEETKESTDSPTENKPQNYFQRCGDQASKRQQKLKKAELKKNNEENNNISTRKEEANQLEIVVVKQTQQQEKQEAKKQKNSTQENNTQKNKSENLEHRKQEETKEILKESKNYYDENKVELWQ